MSLMDLVVSPWVLESNGSSCGFKRALELRTQREAISVAVNINP